jgi:hypothetical protein
MLINSCTHSHDLDYIDSIKRNSGIRTLVTDPFFTSWESGPILAYLKDATNSPPSTPTLLTDAGGKYLERREIINIFSQHLKKAYPGLDVSQIKKQRERYEGVKTCNFKGCNLSFRTGKELTAHRKLAHEERKHDHSARLYTCPCKACHRRKRSKGFPTVAALKEHQIRMQHWGPGTYHGDDAGPRLIEAATEADRLAALSAPPQQQMSTIIQQQPLPNAPPDLPLFPSMPGDDVDDDMPIDPSIQNMHHPMHSSPHQHHGMETQSVQQKQDMMHRLQTLEMEQNRIDMEKARVQREMEALRNAIYSG